MLSKNETITCLELMKNDCRLLKSLYKVYTEQAAAEKPRETNAASELYRQTSTSVMSVRFLPAIGCIPEIKTENR